jgi:hypothetical protein
MPADLRRVMLAQHRLRSGVTRPSTMPADLRRVMRRGAKPRRTQMESAASRELPHVLTTEAACKSRGPHASPCSCFGFLLRERLP